MRIQPFVHIDKASISKNDPQKPFSSYGSMDGKVVIEMDPLLLEGKEQNFVQSTSASYSLPTTSHLAKNLVDFTYRSVIGVAKTVGQFSAGFFGCAILFPLKDFIISGDRYIKHHISPLLNLLSGKVGSEAFEPLSQSEKEKVIQNFEELSKKHLNQTNLSDEDKTFLFNYLRNVLNKSECPKKEFSHFIKRIFFSPEMQELAKEFEKDQSFITFNQYIAILQSCFRAPILEEILFRGLLQDILLDRFVRWTVNKLGLNDSKWTSSKAYTAGRILITSALFSYVHSFNSAHFTDEYVAEQIKQSFFAGLFFGLIKESPLGLAGSIGAHMINNVIAMLPLLMRPCY